MPNYSFSFDPAASGLPYTITDRSGIQVASGTLGSSEDVVTVTADLPWGFYQGRAAAAGMTYASTPAYFASGDTSSGGVGASETDGVGAVFFGGENLAAPFDNTYYFSPFINADEPPRAPQRDDLMVIDGEDDTVINVVRSGLYDISLNVPVQPRDLVVGSGEGPYQAEAVVQVWVNGNSFPPAYDYNNRAQWIVTENDPTDFKATVFTNWTFPQVLEAGDTIQLAVKGTTSGGTGTLGGAIHLDPDITFVLTYRGTVPA